MAHAGGGHHAQHTVYQAQTGPEDGHHGELLTGQSGQLRLTQGSLHHLGGQRQVAGGLVGDQHADLGNQLPEILDAGVLVPEDGELVGHQGMVHDVDFFAKHGASPLYIKIINPR